MVVFNVESSERLQGRYELGELIGEGGFARVYAGFDTVLERAVAVKFLNLAIAGHGLAQRERILTRFEQEAKIAAMLQHPSVVTIFDFGVVDDDSPQPYIVMERLDGSDLQAVLDEHGAMAPGRVLRLLTGCLLGLAVAHEAGVIHKDLKPSNLILCGEGTGEESLKIVDFGVAHLKTLQRRLTLDGSLQGTPQYLPPEYIKEQLVSPAYDVYQMGLVLVEMLTGQGVVGRSEPVASLLIHGSGRISVPSGLLSGPLGPVISRALSFDHHKRYADAREFATALQGLAPMDDGRIRDMAATPPILLVDSLPEIPQPGGQSSGVAGGQDFFGRDDELAALGTLLENHRLVTILGPGGMGKTRLTREFLRREDRQSASYFVELAGIDTLEGILASLGATLGGEEPVSTVDQVCHLLNTKESLLLVLDNLEQITDASAQLIESILAACENICILCTSRESLSLRGEALLVLEALSEEDAIRLFTHQARQKVYDFELDAAELEAVGSIARRVEGLPLALELAAGHVRILSPSQLAARLDESLGTIRSLNRDHGERHRHLRRTFEWSWNLLDEDEQRVLAQCSLFVRPFTLEIVPAVVETEGDDLEMIFELLVSKSLIQARRAEGVVSFVLLEAVREFAFEKLVESFPELYRAAAARHVELWIEACETHAPMAARRMDEAIVAVERGFAVCPARAVHLVASAHPLLDAACRWESFVALATAALEVCTDEDRSLTIKLLYALSMVLPRLERLEEGRAMGARLRALGEDAERPADRVQAYLSCGYLALRDGNRAGGVHFFDEARLVATAAGLAEKASIATNNCGNALIHAGRSSEAVDLLSDHLSSEIDEDLRVRLEVTLGWAHGTLGEWQKASYYLDRAMGPLEKGKDLRFHSFARYCHGHSLRFSQPSTARIHLERLEALARSTGQTVLQCEAWMLLAQPNISADPRVRRDLLERAVELSVGLLNHNVTTGAHGLLGTELLRCGLLDDAHQEFEKALGVLDRRDEPNWKGTLECLMAYTAGRLGWLDQWVELMDLAEGHLNERPVEILQAFHQWCQRSIEPDFDGRIDAEFPEHFELVRLRMEIAGVFTDWSWVDLMPALRHAVGNV